MREQGNHARWQLIPQVAPPASVKYQGFLFLKVCHTSQPPAISASPQQQTTGPKVNKSKRSLPTAWADAEG